MSLRWSIEPLGRKLIKTDYNGLRSASPIEGGEEQPETWSRPVDGNSEALRGISERRNTAEEIGTSAICALCGADCVLVYENRC